MPRVRKTTPRYPSGQVRPERSPSQIRRVLERAASDSRMAEFGTILGRFALEGKITSAQFNAGSRYARTLDDYRRVKGIPAPHARSAMLERGGRSLSPDDDPEIVQQVCRRYSECINTLDNVHPKAVFIVEGAVDFDRMTAGFDELRILRSGLARLAVVFGIVENETA